MIKYIRVSRHAKTEKFDVNVCNMDDQIKI